MKMWFLMVTTVATAVLVDAGYLYNTLNAPYNPPSNQLTYNNYPLYNFQRYYYDNEAESRRNANFKNDFNHVFGNPNYFAHQRQTIQSQNVQNYMKGYSNNGYAANTQNFQSLNSYNNNYAQNNWQQPVSPLSVSANVGFTPVSPLPVNSNLKLNDVSPSPNINGNLGYTQTGLPISSNNNYNKLYLQTHAPLAPASQQNIYPQPFTPIGGNNLNNNFAGTATAAGVNSNGPVNLSSSNGYNHDTQASGSLTNAYGQTTNTPTGVNSNTGPGNSFTSSLPVNSNNEYAQVVMSSTSNQINSGFHQTLLPPVQQPHITTTGSSNLNTGYQQTSTLSNSVNSFVPNQISNSDGSSNNGYAQSPKGPTHVDLSSDLSVTSTGGNFNEGQKKLGGPVSTLISHGSNSQSVTPIVHKHIYFHVPPPEIEEIGKPNPQSLQSKKNYKILFIKVPSQESRSKLYRLQEQLRNTAIEEKTIIYVLVKKPEDPNPLVLPQPKPSEHQVFYVKYNESPFDIARQVNEELDKTGTINSIVPLAPGLPNGQHK